jgi:hypothetical protein
MVFGLGTSDGTRRYLTLFHRSPATGHTCLPTPVWPCVASACTSTGAILLYAPGRAFTASWSLAFVTRKHPKRPSAPTPKPGRSGMPSSTRHTQYEAARKTGDREHKKISVAPDLIRGLLATDQLHSHREWTPDQVRGCGGGRVVGPHILHPSFAIVRFNRTIQRSPTLSAPQ